MKKQPQILICCQIPGKLTALYLESRASLISLAHCKFSFCKVIAIITSSFTDFYKSEDKPFGCWTSWPSASRRRWRRPPSPPGPSSPPCRSGGPSGRWTPPPGHGWSVHGSEFELGWVKDFGSSWRLQFRDFLVQSLWLTRSNSRERFTLPPFLGPRGPLRVY